MNRYLIILTAFCLLSFNVVFSQHITWIPTDASLSGNINELAAQGNDIFAGTVAGVYKTTNSGDSWFLTNSGLANTKVFALAVKNENEIYCGTHGGIYYSSNKGTDWVHKSTGLTDKFVTTICIKDDSSLYVGTLYSGMFYSNDNANNWVQVIGDFSKKAVNAIAIRHTGEVYVGSTSGLYRSDANGQNYIEMKNDLPNELNVYTIQIRRNGIVYFGTRQGQVFRTINNGNSWTLQYQIPGKIQIYSGLLTPNGALLYSTYGQGVYRSNDNAETFEQINDGLSNLKTMTLAQDANGDFFVGTWGSGVFRGAEPPITTSASGTYCAGSELTVSYTIKNGFTFEPGNVFYVELSNKNGSFAKSDTIGSLASVDNGTIICKLPGSTEFGTNYKVRVVGSNPSAVGASNEGELIINEKPDGDFHGELKVCINSSEQYGIGSQANVRSEWYVNGGTIKSPATADTIDVDWSFSEDASITLIRHNIITGCSDTVIRNISFYPQPSKPTITKMDNLLVSSSNTGNQWFRNTIIMQGETDKVLELKEPGLYTVQVTSKEGCLSEVSDVFDYNVNSVETQQLMSQISVYPVPSDGIVNIKFEINQPENIELSIHSLSGDILGVRKLGYLTNGNIQQINLTNFTNGTYYLNIKIGKEMIIKKVIITR